MLENNNKPSFLRTRGFYVKMRLLHNNNNNTRSSTRNHQSFCYRYVEWMIWFAISLYFFSSFLITRDKPTSFSRTVVSKPKASRALIEERVLSSSEDLYALNSSTGPFKGMKVYIYDLPPIYNSDWLANERCSTHLFASEVAIHRALLTSHVRTLDPWRADFFFVPVYVSCNFSKVNGFPMIGHARSLMSEAIQHVSSQLPFWNRSKGADHVFVASHDFGSCFHTMEDAAIADGVPQFLKNSIILQTFGVKHKHPCQDVEHIVIPPYIPPKTIESTLRKSPLTVRRDIFAFFRGKMEVHPKNVSGRYYSKRVRTIILRRYGNDRRFYLRRHTFAGYQSEMARSKFCLCPLGWAPWSPRLVESVVLGCVPIVVADGIRLPFESVVQWPEISLTVAEADVDGLGRVLEHVAGSNYTSIVRNLMDPKVGNALMFHEPMLEGDATWLVLLALSDKLDRSHKVSSEDFWPMRERHVVLDS